MDKKQITTTIKQLENEQLAKELEIKKIKQEILKLRTTYYRMIEEEEKAKKPKDLDISFLSGPWD